MRSVILFTCLVASALAYPSGAPSGACAKLAPIHGGGAILPQNSPAPYKIVVDQTSWNANGNVKVSFSGDEVNGFILQAREKILGTGVGMFDASNLPDGVQAGPCTTASGDKTSLTHTNPDSKTDLQFTWMPPSNGYSGDIYFQAAFAKSHSVFWVNVTSEDVKGPGPQ